VIVIGPYLRMRRGDADAQASEAARGSEARLDEATGLARAIDLTIFRRADCALSQIRPATYLGKGKVEEITGLIAGHDIELVGDGLCAVANPAAQSREGVEHQGSRPHRTDPEIFGRAPRPRRARCRSNSRISTISAGRLVRSWTHLERQRGGFGFMGGPGETQIEADRRLIGDRITRLENELKKVQATRRLHRAGRQRVPYRVVGIGWLHQCRASRRCSPAHAC